MNASQIRSTVEQLYPAFLRDLEALVNIDSGSENVEGLRRVVDYLIPAWRTWACPQPWNGMIVTGPF